MLTRFKSKKMEEEVAALNSRGERQEQEMTALKTMLEEVLKRLPPTEEKAVGNSVGGIPNREGNRELKVIPRVQTVSRPS